MKNYKVASFFAGVGGIDIGFERAGFDLCWANEIDTNASTTYSLNFSSPLRTGDINKIDASEIPDFEVMVGGFPCQAFSVAGYRKGFKDERGNLFFELERIFKAKSPSIVFLENVKNLVTHDKGNTFKVILQHLQEAGYHVKYQVLNASEYGNIPQNRERIYIVGFKDPRVAEAFSFPEKIPLETPLSELIDFSSEMDESLYYRKEKCAFYDELEKNITTQSTLYQWRRHYVRENKSGLCPTLTANMGTGGHNVPLILSDHGIRKLSPRECFNLMGFPSDYKLPDLSKSHLYKQAGNSVIVPVIERIAKQIALALDQVQKTTTP